MQVLCPTCSQGVTVGPLPSGTLPSCPHCGAVFRLPESAAPASGQAKPTAVAPAANAAPRETAPLKAPVAEPQAIFQDRVHRQRVKSPSSSIGWGLFLGVFFLGLVAAIGWVVFSVFLDGGPQTPATNGGSWTAVGSWEGGGELRTQRFEIRRSPWRIRWQATPREGPQRKKNFDVAVFTPDGQIVATPIKQVGGGADETLVNAPPGDYYLQVYAFDINWRLTVEDRR